MIGQQSSERGVSTSQSSERGVSTSQSSERGVSTSLSSERGVSTSLSYVIAIGITSVLVISLLTAVGGFLQEQRERAVQRNVETVGNKLVVQFERVDRLVTQTKAGDSASPIRVSVSLPESISGNSYSVSVASSSPPCASGAPGTCLVVSVPNADVTEVFPLDLNLDPGAGEVVLRGRGNGEYLIEAYAPGTTTSDMETGTWTRSGIGAKYIPNVNTIGVIGLPPNPAFTLSSTEVHSEEPVTLDASETDDQDGTVTAYLWDLDQDGRYEARGKTPTVTLDPLELGKQKVTLKAIDNDGNSAITTEKLTVSGLAYKEFGDRTNLQATGGPSRDGFKFKLYNEYKAGYGAPGSEAELESLYVDPETKLTLGSNGYIIGNVGDDYSQEIDEELPASYSTIPDGGRLIDLEYVSNGYIHPVGEGQEVAFEIGNFDDEVFGKKLTLTTRYEIDSTTKTTTITDTVGAPDIRNFHLEFDQATEVLTATFESNVDIDDEGELELKIKHYVEGTQQGPTETITESNPEVTCSPIGYGFYNPVFSTCTIEIASRTTPTPMILEDGRYEVTLTTATNTEGVSVEAKSDDVPITRNSLVVTDQESKYTWDDAVDWNPDPSATVDDPRRGIAYADFGPGPQAEGLKLGLPGSDQTPGKSALFAHYTFDRTTQPSGGEAQLRDEDDGPDEDGTENVVTGIVDRGVVGFHGTAADAVTGGYYEVSSLKNVRAGSTGTVTASAWFKPDGSIPSGLTMLIGNRRSSSLRDWALVTYQTCPVGNTGWSDNAKCVGSGPYVGFVSRSSDRYALLYGPVEPDEWHHVAFSYDGPNDKLVLHYDGSVVAKSDITDSASQQSGYGGVVGKGFPGQLEHVRVYERPLSNQQIKRNLYDTAYNGTITSKWKSGATISSGDLALRYQADIGPGQAISVTVETPSGTSRTVQLSDGINTITQFPNLPSASKYRVIVRIETSAPYTTPRLYRLQLYDQTP